MGSLEDHFQHLNISCLPKLHSFSVGKFMHWSLTSLPDTQLHNRTMPTGTQPQIWKFWWTKNCPTSTSKVPYKFCQVIALLLIPAKNPLTSFNKNTTGPTWPCAIPFPKRYHSTNILQSTQNTGCNLFLPHGSGAGPEGLRPQHLKDCRSISAGDARALRSSPA